MLARFALTGAAVALSVMPVRLPAQAPVPARALMDSVVAANSRPLSMLGGALQGAGADFIYAEAAKAQFVALGEEHNATEVPQFVTALFHALQARSGYHYLADEQDPASLRVASRPPVRGVLDSIVAISRRYPHAFTFMSDQELTLLAEVGRLSTGRGNPLWGCDQAFGAAHVLDLLLATPLSAGERASVTSLRDEALAKERTRNLEKYHYMSTEPKSEKFAALLPIAAAHQRNDAPFLLQSLVVSDRIYRNYREKHYYDNGHEREEYMKSRFMDEYRRAEAADGKLPKVILKFGHWHVFRGLGPSNLQTLGNFASELAKSHEMGSFHIAMFPFGDPGGYGDVDAWSDKTPKMLASAASHDRMTVVDLRPLRTVFSKVTAEMSPTDKDNFRRWIYGFDAALFMGRLKRATYTFNPGVQY
jgi:hypothetical protein